MTVMSKGVPSNRAILRLGETFSQEVKMLSARLFIAIASVKSLVVFWVTMIHPVGCSRLVDWSTPPSGVG